MIKERTPARPGHAHARLADESSPQDLRDKSRPGGQVHGIPTARARSHRGRPAPPPNLVHLLAARPVQHGGQPADHGSEPACRGQSSPSRANSRRSARMPAGCRSRRELSIFGNRRGCTGTPQVPARRGSLHEIAADLPVVLMAAGRPRRAARSARPAAAPGVDLNRAWVSARSRSAASACAAGQAADVSPRGVPRPAHHDSHLPGHRRAPPRAPVYAVAR